MEGGFGLLGLQERANLLNGELKTTSSFGQGFRGVFNSHFGMYVFSRLKASFFACICNEQKVVFVGEFFESCFRYDDDVLRPAENNSSFLSINIR